MLVKLDFFDRYSKIAEVSNFTKIRLVGAETDRHRDTTDLIENFRYSVKAPKHYSSTLGLDFPACLRRLI